MTGEAHTTLHCMCDRCARPFERPYSVPLHAVLTTEVAEEEDEWTFLLVDDCADLDEIILTSFLFGLDMQLLCRLVAGLLPVTHHAGRHIHALQEKKSGHRHAVSAVVAHTAHHQHFIQAELLCMQCLYRF